MFSSQLRLELDKTAGNLSPDTVKAVLSSVQAIFTLPNGEKALVQNAYISAINYVFLIGVPSAALASFSALLISRRKIVKNESSRPSLEA